MLNKNPFPVLNKHCGVSKQELPGLLGVEALTAEKLQLYATKSFLPARFHSRLFDVSMYHVFHHKDQEVRHLLWRCYFETYKPHILHLMVFLFFIPEERIVKKSGLTQQTIRRYLRKPRLKRAQLRRIAPMAVKLEEMFNSTGETAKAVKIHVTARS